MSLFLKIGDGSFRDLVYLHVYPLSRRMTVTVIEQEIADTELANILDQFINIEVDEQSSELALRLAFEIALHKRDAARLWAISSFMEEKAGKPRAQYFIEIAADLFVEAYLPER